MRQKPRAYCALASILITTTSLISTIHATQIGTTAMGEPPQNISKREQQLVGIIERHALSFEIEKFVKDPILMQTTTYTKYINPLAKSKDAKTVLRKKNEDTGKVSLVLSSRNNRFAIPTPRGAKKRQFVLLRQGPNQHDDEAVSYYSSLIFVRNLYPGDESDFDNDGEKDTFEVDGVESVVELDIWEHRPRQFFPGWGNCDWSILFTCASFKNIQEDAKKAVKSRRRKRSALLPDEAEFEEQGELHRLFKRVPADDGAPPELTAIVGAPGFDPATYNDLYLDMDFHRFDVLYKQAAEKAAKDKKSRRKRSLDVLHRVKRGFGGSGSARGSLGGSVSFDGGGGGGGAMSGLASGSGSGSGKGGGSVKGGGSGKAQAKQEKAQQKEKKKKAKSDLNSQAGGGGGLFGNDEAALSPGVNFNGGGDGSKAGKGAVSGIGKQVGDGAKAGKGAASGAGKQVGDGAKAGAAAASEAGKKVEDGAKAGAAAGAAAASEAGKQVEDGAQAGAASASEAGEGLGDMFEGLSGAGDAADGFDVASMLDGYSGPDSDSSGNSGGLANMFSGGGGGSFSVGGSAAIGDSFSGMFGGAMEAVAKGMGGSIVQAGEWIVNTWSVLGRSKIEHSADHLMKMGIPKDFAKLAVVGKCLATSSFSGMFAGQFKFGWRIGIDSAGCDQNGGEHAGKGFEGEESLPTNENYQYGLLYNGAENGMYFFLPEGSLVRVTVKVSGGKEFNAWFEPKLSGLDGIFPDKDDAYKEAVGSSVKVLPIQYEQEEAESDPGIKGTLKEGYKFANDGKKISGVYKPEDDEWEEQVWMPPELEEKESRPASTPEDQKIFYGYLFNGIEDSPHIFLAEGDTLTGVFVPADSNHPELTDTPHGIFTPIHPGGHAIFVADDPRETKDFNEVRGVFLPDAMDLSGGISGKLGKWEECNCDIKFSFVLDRPGVDYMYVAGEAQKNIWSPYIDPDDWEFEPNNPDVDEDDEAASESNAPEEDDEDEVPDPLPDKKKKKKKKGKKKDKKEKNDKKKEPEEATTTEPSADEEAEAEEDEDEELSTNEKKKIKYSGAKIKTKHSLSFIPEDYTISGSLTPVDLKKKKAYKVMQVDMIMTNPDDPWAFNVTKKDEKADKLPDGLAGLFAPMTFPKNDALVGKLILDAGQMTGKYVVKGLLPVEAHLWVATDEMWVPVGFTEKQTAEAKAELDKQPKEVQEEKAIKAEMKAKKNAEKKKAEKDDQNVKKQKEKEKQNKEKEEEIKKAGHKPKKKKEPKSESNVPGTEGDSPPRHNSNMLEGKRKEKIKENPELNNELDEEGNEESDEYVHGFYIKSSKSPEPIFAPDTGTQGIFITDKKKEAKAWYFPKRGELDSALIIDPKSKIPNGAKGKFYTVNSTDQKSIGFIEGTYKDTELQMKANDLEMIPGWEMRDEEPVVESDLNLKDIDMDDEHFIPSERGQKYALVDIGGGYKGVIVGSGKALDDPNNPIFQEFLHFRMARDGDANPWGRVAIVDPIEREKANNSKNGSDDGSVFGANMTLGKGRFIDNNLTAEIMSGFSLSNWDQPEITEYVGGGKLEPVTMGKRTNVVNMMDFRMFLFTKYSCKRAEVEGDNIVMIAPKAANGFVNVTSHARPREKWLEAVNEAGETLIFPEEEAVVGKFSATFELDAENVAPYERPVGGGTPNTTSGNGSKDTGNWKTSAPFEDWGDENACDEIALDEMQASQAIAAMQEAKEDNKTSNGISLGYKLVHGRGNRIKFHKIAKKFLKNYERRSVEGEEGLKEAQAEGGSTTDLMGGKSKQAESQADQQAKFEKAIEDRKKGKGKGKLKGDAKGKDEKTKSKDKAEGEGEGGASAGGDASGGGASGGGASGGGASGGGASGGGASGGGDVNASGGGSVKASGKSKNMIAGRTFGTEPPEPSDHAKVLPGWRTQYRDMKQNATLSDSGIMFFGLGNCEHTEIPDIELLMSKKLDKVIKYYMKILRIDCMNNVEGKLVDLINQGFLKLAKDGEFGYFIISEDNALMRAQRLTPPELKKISLAWEFHAVTRTYAKMRERQFLTTEFYREPNCDVSRSGLFFTELSHYTVAFARKATPTHGVRMNRNMLTTLRTIMTKLQQDWLKLEEECTDCDLDRRLTIGDKYRVMSLMQFIIYGLGPYHYKEKYPRAAFNQFVELNNVAITERVKEFERQYALKTQGKI